MGSSQKSSDCSEVGIKRLLKDYKALVDHGKDQGIVVRLVDGDITTWEAMITGPENTAWEGGLFRMKLQFDKNFPIEPPTVRFLTPMFHPNIYVDGRVCMSILKSEWSPSLSIESLLVSIQSLLSDPNPKSAANGEAGVLFVEDPNAYYKRVMEYVEASLTFEDSSDCDEDD